MPLSNVQTPGSGHGRTGAGIDQLHSPKQICSKFVIDAGSLPGHDAKLILSDDSDPKLLRLAQLAPGIFTGQHIVCLLAYTARCAPSTPTNKLLKFFTALA